MAVATGLAAAALVTGPGSVQGAGQATRAALPATFTVRIDAQGRGTFTVRGGIVDGGRALVRRAVVNGHLNATERLTGGHGSIVLTSRQRCGGTGAWRVSSGTLGYGRLSGRGVTSGRTSCGRPLGPAVLVHRGTVELPPPTLAQPGAWGGRTTQGSVVAFTVTPDGRSITGVLVTRYRYECVRSDGQRSTSLSPSESRFAGPFAIAEDRTFNVKTFSGTLTGRFGTSGAEGTIGVATTSRPNVAGQVTTCSASIPWTATNPPGPPPQALSGTYCAITAAGGGVCLDVPAGGREARNLRAEIKLTCGIRAQIPVSVAIAYGPAMPFARDLSFRQSFEQAFEGKTLSASVSGTFDESGGLVGSVGVAPFTVERDGGSHLCRTNGGFTARLQR